MPLTEFDLKQLELEIALKSERLEQERIALHQKFAEEQATLRKKYEDEQAKMVADNKAAEERAAKRRAEEKAAQEELLRQEAVKKAAAEREKNEKEAEIAAAYERADRLSKKLDELEIAEENARKMLSSTVYSTAADVPEMSAHLRQLMRQGTHNYNED
jgi:membrane protein involved in colicin uptake